MLPPHVPSSFTGKHGSVRYYVKANIVRDWKWDHKVKQHIMVNGICDLNLLPAAKMEGQYYRISFETTNNSSEIFSSDHQGT